jgi:hypothetical protein
MRIVYTAKYQVEQVASDHWSYTDPAKVLAKVAWWWSADILPLTSSHPV